MCRNVVVVFMKFRINRIKSVFFCIIYAYDNCLVAVFYRDTLLFCLQWKNEISYFKDFQQTLQVYSFPKALASVAI